MQRLSKRSNGAWTFRVSVPEKLREKIGKREIWKSFGAVSYAEARALARVESLKVDARFALAAENGDTKERHSTLSDAEILMIAQRYLHRLEANAEAVPFDETSRLERSMRAQEDALDIAQGGIADPGLQRVATSIAGEAEAVSLSGADLLRITEAVQRALLEHYAREEDRASLRTERRYDPAFADVDARNVPTPPLTVAKAIEAYKADPERSNVAKRTRTAYDFRYRLLEELLGREKDIAKVTRTDVREVRDVLLRLPPNAAKRYPMKTLREIAEIATRDRVTPMAPKSAVLYVEALSALFNWLTKEEMVPRNPAVGLKGPGLNDETDRRPFSIAELSGLFAAPTFGGAKGKGWIYWMPRLALFTGARFAELLALRVIDIVEIDGVACISIVPTEMRKLKTKGSKRLVPIHPQLSDAGFLQHVARQPKNGLLFPDAAGPKDMINARNKEMGRAVRAVFKDRSLVFHGLRHAFKDAASRARIPRELVSLIGGWKVGDGHAAMDSYGRDKLLPVLFEEISKIQFPGVSLCEKSET